MTQSHICERAFVFAVRIIKISDVLAERGISSRHFASQLLKSATSIGANAEEAQEAQTKADFIAKLSVSRKESRETSWWLRLAVASGKLESQEIKWELGEATELLLMIRAAIRTARSSKNRKSKSQPADGIAHRTRQEL
jgi:four helix bundle protein